MLIKVLAMIECHILTYLQFFYLLASSWHGRHARSPHRNHLQPPVLTPTPIQHFLQYLHFPPLSPLHFCLCVFSPLSQSLLSTIVTVASLIPPKFLKKHCTNLRHTIRTAQVKTSTADYCVIDLSVAK